MNTLLLSIETLLVQVLQSDPILAAIGVSAEDVDNESVQVQVVVKGESVKSEAPNQINPAKDVRRIDITASLRGSLGQTAAADLARYYGALCTDLENLNPAIVAPIAIALGFVYLQVIPENMSERERDSQRRTYTKKGSFFAAINPALATA